MPGLLYLDTQKFKKWVRKNRLEKALKSLKKTLDENPDTGDVIPGSGGLRKVRMVVPGRGKRGGARIIYALTLNRIYAIMLFGYYKSEQEDLTVEQYRELAAIAAGYEAILQEDQRHQDKENERE